MTNEIDDIKRRAGITEDNTPFSTTDKATARIWDNIIHAMQDAEEMGGPEGKHYVKLMNAVAREATNRARTAQTNYDNDQNSQDMSRILRPAR